jgi:hypothetical protein
MNTLIRRGGVRTSYPRRRIPTAAHFKFIHLLVVIVTHCDSRNYYQDLDKYINFTFTAFKPLLDSMNDAKHLANNEQRSTRAVNESKLNVKLFLWMELTYVVPIE